MKHFDDNVSVFVLDDDVIGSDKPFLFTSIDQVVQACMKSLSLFLSEDFPREIILGGWSYGGVVAFELAKLLSSQSFEHLHIKVEKVILLDAPVCKAVVTAIQEDIFPLHAEPFNGMKEDRLMLRSKSHFEACTAILALYHKSAREKMCASLTCDIIDIRASAGSQSENAENLLLMFTAGHVFSAILPDATHWTMLTKEYARQIADFIKLHI